VCLPRTGLFLVPRVRSCKKEAYPIRGNTWFSVQLEVEYEVHAADGSMLSATVYGEAMDTGDKATNKAMSAAYKYLCFQLFCIPVGNDDADDTVPPVQSIEERQQTPPPKPAPKAPKAKPAGVGLEKIAEFSNRLAAAKDDVDAAQVCREIAAAIPQIEKPEHRAELAGQAVKVRAELVVEEALPSLDKMCEVFEQMGALPGSVGFSARNAARSRLNVDLIEK
jgi:hypothetical protein